jgi:hypothetical protein
MICPQRDPRAGSIGATTRFSGTSKLAIRRGGHSRSPAGDDVYGDEITIGRFDDERVDDVVLARNRVKTWSRTRAQGGFMASRPRCSTAWAYPLEGAMLKILDVT